MVHSALSFFCREGGRTLQEVGMGAVEPGGPVGVFFWARLGGGHRTAKEALKERVVDECARRGEKLDTTADIDIGGEKILNAVRIPFFGKLGDCGADAWNNAQKAGNLRFLRFFAAMQWIGELLFFPIVYFQAKKIFQNLREEPRYVISTQAFCLNAIARAMLATNAKKKWNMHLDVYLTDLPSKKATHFFPSIRRVSKSPWLRKLVTLHAPKPVLKEGQSEEKFWEKHCGKVQVITSDPYPIRKAFFQTEKLKSALSQPTLDVSLRLNHPGEAAIIDCGMGTSPSVGDEGYRIRMKEKDKVGLLMLGSVPTKESVLGWLRSFVQSGKEAHSEKSDRHQYFFLYCGAPETASERNTLLASVSQELISMRASGQIPPNMHIVPFTNQGADEIALLMARSDLTITRSGGATSMELLQLHKEFRRKNKCVFIHSEALVDQPKVLARERQTLERLAANVRRHHEGAKGSDEEWRLIEQSMLDGCKGLGISSKTSKKIVDDIVDLYRNDRKKSKDVVGSLLQAFEHGTKPVSSTRVRREGKIQRKISELKKKVKFAALSEDEYRKLAIKKLLVDEGIILWEAKNARYLEKIMGAEVVNPEFASPRMVKDFFQS